MRLVPTREVAIVKRVRWLWPFLLMTGCASRPEPPPERPLPPPPPLRVAPEGAFASEFPDADRTSHLASALPAIDTAIRERFARGAAPGLAVAVIIDGAVALQVTLGEADAETKRPVDKQTRFRIGSVTKTFTAFAIEKLAQDNALELDEPLENLVPEAEAVLYPTADAPKVSLRHLLSHQSGLPMNGNYDFSASAKAPPTEADVVAALSGVVLEAVPGTRTRYSNLGFSLLGIVVNRAAGQSYRDYLATNVFKPLAMPSAAWDGASLKPEVASRSFAKRDGAWVALPFEQLGASEADGGLWLDIDDLGRWASAMLDAYPPRSGPDKGPLPRAVVRAMLGTQDAGFGFGASTSCRGERVVSKMGGIDKYVALVELMPDHGVAIVSMANGDFPLAAMQLEVRDKLRASKGLVARRPVPSAALTAVAQRFVSHRNAFAEADYDALFSDYYRATVAAADQKRWMDESVKKVGACKEPVISSVKAPRDASFEVECERGWGKFSIQLSAYGDVIAMLSSEFLEGAKPKPVVDPACP